MDLHPEYSITAYFALKLALRCRWESSCRKNHVAYKDLSCKLFWLLKYVWASDVITLQDKFMSWMFCVSNGFYKLVRKMVDPSMKKIEESWKHGD